MKKRLSRCSVKEVFIVLAFALFMNEVVYNLSRYIAGSLYHHDMTTYLDRLIPFIPWTVSIYFGCYLFWALNYWFCATHEKTERDRFFCADLLSKTICFILFLAIPTTNIRPDIPGEGLWDCMMKILYRIDAADNLFPSIHCLVSWLCWIGVRKRKDIHAFYRSFSFVAAIAVCISTLTTRQHVIADVIAAILLAESCYWVSGFAKVRAVYSSIISHIYHAVFRK